MGNFVKVKAIAAMDEERAIGRSNSLPWDVPEDMKHFVTLTKGHTVLMGRKTFESAPMNSRPLKGRLNIVVSRTSISPNPDNPDLKFINDPIEFIKRCKSGQELLKTDTLWIIGGAEIYRLTMPLWDEVHLTLISGTHQGDAFFPEFEKDFNLNTSNKTESCTFQHYIRR